MNGDVLFCGAWDEGPGYPRTVSLRQGLVANGVAVRECRVPGLGRDKHRLLRSPWRWPGLWLRSRSDCARLRRGLEAALRERRPRCVVVPYPGHGVVRHVKRTAGVPVVLDLFLSAYDTVVEDRAMVRPGSLGAWWLQHLDTEACAAADLVLVDTPANAAYVAALTGQPAEKFVWLPVHDPDAGAAAPWRPPTGPLQLLFFGTGVPLHGLDVLVAAVAAVPGVQLTLVGGTEFDRAEAMARLGNRLSLQPEFVATKQLQRLLAQSHLVAGVFGTSGKAQRVVPFKLVHALAAGRPVVTADTPAVCNWLDGSGAVFLSPAGDAMALAATLRELVAVPDRVAAAAAAARPAYEQHFGTSALARRWAAVLDRLRSVGAA
ncbi:MAG: glycosyltransferase [Planctomycetes bacterium]|nr:glycosyltransferase [Planctomycetota bacterium]